MMSNFVRVLEFDELARKEAKQYNIKRPLFFPLEKHKGRHFCGIIGPRGVGKTVILRQLALQLPKSLYISFDTLDQSTDLFSLIKTSVIDYQYQNILLDEIHFLPGYSAHLKKIYDLLQVKLYFTSSVALSLAESAFDLSRRVKMYSLYPLSFREYLQFKQGIKAQGLSFDEIIQNTWDKQLIKYQHHFERYLKGGLLTFSIHEPDPLPLLENILEKVISQDLPMVNNFTVQEVSQLKKTVRFCGRSAVDGINYSTLSRNLGISKYKAEIYLEMFKKAFVLNPVFPTGTNVLREPKVLMYLPYRLLFKDYEDCIGGLREDFFAQTMNMAGIPFHYLKTTRGGKTPDFLIEYDNKEWVVEIGGKGKGRTQFKGVSNKEKIILTHSADFSGLKRPLFLIGLMDF